MGRKHYPPVPVSICKDMLLELFSAKEEFGQSIAPKGLWRSEFASFFRPHLLWEYKWYRLRRLHLRRQNREVDRELPLSLEEFMAENCYDIIDHELETTLILAYVVVEIFDYPHVVFDRDGCSYRLAMPVTISENPNEFLLSVLQEFGILPDTLEGLDRYHNHKVNLEMSRKEANIEDYDFTEAYRFIFRHLRERGYDWDFGSYVHMMGDFLYYHVQEKNKMEETNPEEYDPHKAVLRDLEREEGDKHENEDDMPIENSHVLDPKERDFWRSFTDGEEEEMKFEQEIKQQAINAYLDVYDKELLGLPDKPSNR